tara:strand:- start:2670 stop:3035 length:366 start_codon:yes stop_codon:yes gene_type:complete
MNDMKKLKAQKDVQRMFTLWYAEKKGFLVPGMLVEEDGMVYKVLSYHEEVFGWFLVTPCTFDGKPLSKLNTVLAYYHESSLKYGAEVFEGNLFETMKAEIHSFIVENPVARKLLQDAGLLP